MSTTHGSEGAGNELRRRWSTILLAVCVSLVFLGFIGLGSWQVWRLQWKTALIARVDARVHASAVSAPDRRHWSGITAQDDEYRHVSVRGTFLNERTTKVQATTVLGRGFWLITPLLVANGDIVLVNRGYVPARASDWQPQDPDRIASLPGPAEPGATVTTVTGLLRMSEPGGAFLRNNDAASGRWYSRDVEAIAAARTLGTVAPYFIDAEANANATPADTGAGVREPVAGLTVIAFHNNHITYALTWFAMALLMALAFLYNLRQSQKE
jgi:surfeit locus 1 family protein